jgi:hypothetical protein
MKKAIGISILIVLFLIIFLVFTSTHGFWMTLLCFAIAIVFALQEKGIVPKKADGEKGAEINPDLWLEQQGWVKIHTNFINFAGCLNEDSEYSKLKNVNMTNVQIKIVYEYISLCYDSVMKLGWRQEVVTAPRFQMLAAVPELMNKNYFSYK